MPAFLRKPCVSEVACPLQVVNEHALDDARERVGVFVGPAEGIVKDEVCAVAFYSGSRASTSMHRDFQPLPGLLLHHFHAVLAQVGPFHDDHVTDALAGVEQQVQREPQGFARDVEKRGDDLRRPRLAAASARYALCGARAPGSAPSVI